MRYFRVLTASLFLHIALGIGLAYITPPKRLEMKRTDFVDLIEQPQLPRRPKQNAFDEKTWTRDVSIPIDMLTSEDKETDFASKDERNVIQQMRARESGATANRSSESANDFQSYSRKPAPRKSSGRGTLDFSPESALDRAKREMKLDSSTPGEGDVRVGGIRPTRPQDLGSDGSKMPNTLPLAGAEQGRSTLGEKLPETIPFGDITALNTDRHLYYSFYSRMEEKTRGRWETYVKASLYNLDDKGRARVLSKTSWTTTLEIVLDKEGKFVKAILHESSGSQSLDSAPVQAFKEAGQFPNPPEGMIGKDGQVHVMYSFNVEVDRRVSLN